MPDEQVTCKCGLPIGIYVLREGKIWLRVGTLEVYAAHGVCAVCGEQFHWASSDKRLDDLIARVKKMREEIKSPAG
jgi:hypothetical protein